MPSELGAQMIQRQVRASRKRTRNFRRARAMFIRNFVGPYYDAAHGKVGFEPLNLIFNAIRVLIPQIVMHNPVARVTSDYLAYADYSELLGFALDRNAEEIRLRDQYRRVIVDSLFAMGIMKTGLTDSNTAMTFDENDSIDPGMIYSEAVDFDHFIFDPSLKGPMTEAAWVGDTITIKRQFLLDSGEYRNELVERLPSVVFNSRDERVSSLSRGDMTSADYENDEVEISEIYIQAAQAIVTVPAGDVVFDDFLRTADYYGPDEGPYSYLALTPPVPGNPLPIAPVGIWNDLHVMGNRLVKKTLDQADRQKDIVAYKPSAVDDAQDLKDASDGETVAVDDPGGIVPLSFGGQQQGNELMVDRIQMWFNEIAGNPQSIGGQALDADSATEATILQGNTDITMGDMRESVYNMASEETKKRAFYLHTDPLIDLPFTRRQTIDTPNGPEQQQIQVFLTPEARRGDFLDYTFKIKPESMKRMSSQERLRVGLEFAVKIMPAAMQAAVLAMQMGQAFNVAVYIEEMAKESGIDWMGKVWYDPTFQRRLMLMAQMGPQPENSKGKAGPMQNKQPGGVMKVRGPQEQTNRDAQMGAAVGQGDLAVRPNY